MSSSTPSSSDNHHLFKCYGIGLVHTSPQHLYPQTRCFGLRRPTNIDYSRYYSNTAFSTYDEAKRSQQPFDGQSTINRNNDTQIAPAEPRRLQRNETRSRNTSNETRQHQPSDKESSQHPNKARLTTNKTNSPTKNGFQPIEISPKSIAQSIGPALSPSLSPNVPLPSEPISEPPKFPRPVHQSNRREDLCLGIMTVDLDSFSRCQGLGIEVLFEEPTSMNDPDHHQHQLDHLPEDIVTTHPSTVLPKYNQEMVPSVMEPSDEVEYEDDDDEEVNDDNDESSMNSIQHQQLNREQLSERLRSGIVNIPSGLWKVGERAFLISKTTGSMVSESTMSTMRHPRTFIENTYNRLFEIEERSREICRRTWTGIGRWMGWGRPPTPPESKSHSD